jgi:RHS repeat-associated protein
LVHQQGKIRGEYDYYPYGLLWYNPSVNEEYDQTYQSKSWIHGNWGDKGVDVYDFHARLHDPVLASWQTPDPLNQFSSPYTSMASNPVSFVDPDGMYSIPIGRWFRRLFGRTPSTGQRLVGSHRGSFITGGFLGNIALGTSSGIASVMAESQRVVPQNADRLAAEAVGSMASGNSKSYSPEAIYNIRFWERQLSPDQWVDYSPFTNETDLVNSLAIETQGSMAAPVPLTLKQLVNIGFQNNAHKDRQKPLLIVRVIPDVITNFSYASTSQSYVEIFDLGMNSLHKSNLIQSDLPDYSVGSAGRGASIRFPKHNANTFGDAYYVKIYSDFSFFDGQNLVPVMRSRVTSIFKISSTPPKNAPRPSINGQ